MMILEERDTFDSINFIGEMSLLIMTLKNSLENVKPLTELAIK